MMRMLQQWSTPGGRPNSEQLEKDRLRQLRLQAPLQATSTPLDIQGFMGK